MPFPYEFPFEFGAQDTSESPSAYARMLKQLLPRGALWLLESSSLLSKLLTAIGDELTRIDSRGVDLLVEADPRTATETLEEWERMLGLPDHCIETIPSTLPERRLAVVQKLIRQGGQHAEFYVSLAAACGYTVTIDDTYGASVLRAGFRAGARCYGLLWAFSWRVDVQPPAGDALSHDELECVIRRAAPAHTTVIFEYL